MKNYIQASKTFRYFTLGNPETAKKLIFVLHGYGQLPEYFIQKFKSLENDYLIVAPEGMHRFYLKGSSGRVGASWMTKEERITDIADTINYLNTLYHQVANQFETNKISVLGFSQGAATAARWFYSNEKLASELIIWASVFPPDLEISSEINPSTTSKNKFVIGTQDEYFNVEQQNELMEFYKTKGFEVFQFDGKHDIDTSTITRVLSE
jgi:predicted esterase